jgi:hypothetical protein
MNFFIQHTYVNFLLNYEFNTIQLTYTFTFTHFIYFHFI